MIFKRSKYQLILLLPFITANIIGCGLQKNKDNTVGPTSDVAPQFSSVVTFGDSLSDSGNIKYITQQFAGSTSPLLKRSVPIEPEGDNSGYYNGRFSNGDNWLDRFVNALNLQLQDAETCLSRGSNLPCNYAMGGATTDNDISSDSDPMETMKSLLKNSFVDKMLNRLHIPHSIGMKQMVETYLDVSKPSSDIMNHTLYIVWGGGNDYLAKTEPDLTVNNIILSIKSILDYNSDNQIRYFLIPNLPDLSQSPYGSDPDHADLNLTEKTKVHNTLLREKIQNEITFNEKYKDKVVVVSVDIEKAFKQIIDNPKEYGFTNVTEACYKGGYMPGSENTDCKDGDHYFFWDNIHPTAKAHCLMTKTVLQTMLSNNLLAKPEVAHNFKCD